MSTIYSNYEAISLSGSPKTLYDLGDGYSASSVHRIHCVIAGNATISTMGGSASSGSTFIWVATANDYIDVLPRAVTVNSGHFIGFRAKHTPIQFFNP